MSVRAYGDPPYRLAVLHGGPGAAGSVACVARALSGTFGVLEPLQSQRSLPSLVSELQDQLSPYGRTALFGHSWGAWLAALYAAAFPAEVTRLILVGSGPFAESYAPQITARRLANLSEADGAAYLRLTKRADALDAAEINLLGSLAERADNVDPVTFTTDSSDLLPPDGALYAQVWKEAAALRASGKLAEALVYVRCPILVIHGARDPHPVEGVTEPLAAHGAAFQCHILPGCGHTPFRERRCLDQFYRLVRQFVLEPV